MRFWGNASSSLFDVDAGAEDMTRVLLLQTSSKSLDVKKNAPFFSAAAAALSHKSGENKKGDHPEDVVVPFRRKRKSARDEMRDMMTMMMMIDMAR